jgi:hypothetical protein
MAATRNLKAELNEKIISSNLVPLSMANSMLFIGSHMKTTDCDFILEKYLIVAGSIALCLSIIGSLSHYIIAWITADGIVNKCEDFILLILTYLNGLMTMVEVGIFLAGTCIVFPHLAHVTFDSNQTDEYFCQKGPFVFTAIFLSLVSLILMAGGICWVILTVKDFYRRRRQTQNPKEEN